MSTKGLYTRREMLAMTDDALDELLSHYNDTGNAVGAERVRDEIQERDDDRMAELEHEEAEAEAQAMHDEMIANTPMAWEGGW